MALHLTECHDDGARTPTRRGAIRKIRRRRRHFRPEGAGCWLATGFGHRVRGPVGRGATVSEHSFGYAVSSLSYVVALLPKSIVRTLQL